MFEKIIVVPNNNQEIEILRNVGISTFLLPLTEFSIGYESFNFEEINQIKGNIYLLINRIMNSQEIENLINIINKLNNIKGIFYEDLGVFEALKDHQYELINYQTHFNTHKEVVNYLLELGNHSVVISDDLTYNEIAYILNNVSNQVCLFIFGKTSVMYSRRKLKSNYQQKYNLQRINKTITEQVSKIKFDLEETDDGTYLFSNYFYKGVDLLTINSNNIKYYIFSNKDLLIEESLKVLNLIKEKKWSEINLNNKQVATGFLYKETIYQLKDSE